MNRKMAWRITCTQGASSRRRWAAAACISNPNKSQYKCTLHPGAELAVGLGGLQPPRPPQTMEPLLSPPQFFRRMRKKGRKKKGRERKKKLGLPWSIPRSDTACTCSHGTCILFFPWKRLTNQSGAYLQSLQSPCLQSERLVQFNPVRNSSACVRMEATRGHDSFCCAECQSFWCFF